MTIYDNQGVVASIGDGPGRHGLYGYYYKVDSSLGDYPDWPNTSLTAKRIDAVLDFNADGETDIFPPNDMTIHYGVQWKGYIYVGTVLGLFLLETEDEDFILTFEDGDEIELENSIESFVLTSDDGSRLYVNDTLVINNDGLHGQTDVAGSVSITEHWNSIEVWFFQNEGGATLQLWNEDKSQIIPTDILYTNPILNNVNVLRGGVARGIGGGSGSESIGIITHTYGPISQITIACHHHAALFNISRKEGYVPTITRCIQKITNQKLKYLSDRNDHE
jgi:hypothetical protein